MKPMNRLTLMAIGALVAFIVALSAQKRAMDNGIHALRDKWIEVSQFFGKWYAKFENALKAYL